MRALFDTNILIDYLIGHNEARLIIEQYENPQISIITKMEVLVGTTEDNEEIIREFLDNFTVIPLNEEIAETAIEIRKNNKIKLPEGLYIQLCKFINKPLNITLNSIVKLY